MIWRKMLRTEEVTDSTKSLYDTTEEEMRHNEEIHALEGKK